MVGVAHLLRALQDKLIQVYMQIDPVACGIGKAVHIVHERGQHGLPVWSEITPSRVMEVQWGLQAQP